MRRHCNSSHYSYHRST